MKEYDHKEIEKKWSPYAKATEGQAEEYNPAVIEKKWQKEWEEKGVYKTEEGTEKDKFYLLFEFPYPSGNLHIGHWYAYANTDVLARYKRMKGFNVLYPMGFDSFGLPAENAAIKRGLDPLKWTNENIEYMKNQIDSMGTSLDWSHEIQTSAPSFYKWTQFIFTKMFEKGLAYQKLGTVNWCPSCQTVLANEQVVNALCERCDSEVEKKEMKQWYLRITEYADRLIEDLKNLDWPEEIKTSQRNWIGKSEGAEFSFEVDKESVSVFTTRPDTLFGVTYLVLAPEHPLLNENKESIENWEEVLEYKIKAQKKSDRERQELREKTGVELKGVYATHPATGENILVWVADYVLASYGTGAVMAVPAHDERDFEFAKRFDLPIKPVVTGGESTQSNWSMEQWGNEWNNWYSNPGNLINSGDFDGIESTEAGQKITEKHGRKETTYRLRDWSVGRQRYWGTPIPIVYDPEGNAHAVPEEHLPWLLPDDVDHNPTGVAPLATSKELKERTENIFGDGWTPEVDTMDTFVDSSWYFVRYIDNSNNEELASIDKLKKWMPVDFYSGGAEHTTLHLLYSRFFYKAMNDMGMVPNGEPYKIRMNRGLILGPDGNKMSKSKGNVIDPDEQVENVGADSVRMYLAFMGPYNETGSYPWDIGGLVGMRRFLERVWNISKYIKSEEKDEIENSLHKTTKKVEEDILKLKFNTAISALMEYVNEIYKKESISPKSYSQLLLLLAPFAPHMAEELWKEHGGEGSIHLEEWPVFNESKIEEDGKTIVVQVNGKTRATFVAATGSSDDYLEKEATNLPDVIKWVEGKEVKKVIVVPERLVNIVTS